MARINDAFKNAWNHTLSAYEQITPQSLSASRQKNSAHNKVERPTLTKFPKICKMKKNIGKRIRKLILQHKEEIPMPIDFTVEYKDGEC
ncbi:hypothetical protein [Bacteroidetes bacterium endosymbiont of Geopemphigus sp.]|uniref:hypothetical protein n=1 Tax=Bacteroidetes bacterium endosymbiont of Geopemphigus sp. TaxID=2047937 RepID=UPI0011AF0691|nr:hypothetical protein [Bacteroidetes bacterium endosymbiont of Geopemphigus sp.]